MWKILIGLTFFVVNSVLASDLSEFERGFLEGKEVCQIAHSREYNMWSCSVLGSREGEKKIIIGAEGYGYGDRGRIEALTVLRNRCRIESDEPLRDLEGNVGDKVSCRKNIRKGNAFCKKL